MRTIFPLCVFVTVALLAVLAHAALSDVRAVRLTVSPQVSFAPTTWQIQVRVHPEPADRWISVQTDNGEFSRMSAFSIERDRWLYSFQWKDIPAGEYIVIAGIGHADVLRASDKLTAVVSGQ